MFELSFLLLYFLKPKRIYDYPSEQREEVRAKRAEQERRYRARRKAQHAEFVEHFKKLLEQGK